MSLTLFIAVACGAVGLCVGSFANVVVHRVPNKQSIVHPRSSCAACGHQIAWYDNVPVVSWVVLRGRCRDCHATISLRYPLVEVGTAALFVAAAVRFGASWSVPAFCVFFAGLIMISAIDLEHFIVPNRVLYPTLFVAAPLLVAAAGLDGNWSRLGAAAAGGAGGFAALLVIHLISPRGMGFGDVRLAGLIGIMLGWLGGRYVVLGIFAGFLIGSVVGVGLIVTRLKTRKDAIPFGPFLGAGAVVATLWGQAILDAYTRGRG